MSSLLLTMYDLKSQFGSHKTSSLSSRTWVLVHPKLSFITFLIITTFEWQLLKTKTTWRVFATKFGAYSLKECCNVIGLFCPSLLSINILILLDSDMPLISVSVSGIKEKSSASCDYHRNEMHYESPPFETRSFC